MVLNSQNRFIKFFYIIAVAVLSGHTLQTVSPWGLYMPFAFGVVSFLLLLFTNKGLKKTGDTYFLIIICTMFLCTIIVNSFAGFSNYFRILCYVFTAFFVATFFPFNDVVMGYRDVITVTTVIALICYVLLQTTDVLANLPAIQNGNDVQYRFALIYNFIEIIPERNCGMFWEPGLLATHLTIAMIVELLFVEKTDWKRMILYSVSFFTANSSAGFVLLLLCLFLAIVRRTNGSKADIIKILLSFIALIALIYIVSNFDLILEETTLGENEYFQKLEAENVKESSRALAIGHNLNIFAQNPLFGAGFIEVAENIEHVADTSTSTYLLSVFGILGVSYTFAWVYGIFKIKNANILTRLVLIAIFLIIVNKEPHHIIVFSWCLLFYFIGGKTEQLLGSKTKKEESGL